jgi:hypothetical protein
MFREIGRLANVPVQEFAVRADSGCGSTIGPILATLSGILTVDVGTPQFSMHSIRYRTIGRRAGGGNIIIDLLIVRTDHTPWIVVVVVVVTCKM